MFVSEEKAWEQADRRVCMLRTEGLCESARFRLCAIPSATEAVHRDIYLINSNDHGKTFQGGLVHKWDINACPMSSMDFAESSDSLVGAWETGGQVYWARIDAGAEAVRLLPHREREGPEAPTRRDKSER